MRTCFQDHSHGVGSVQGPGVCWLWPPLFPAPGLLSGAAGFPQRELGRERERAQNTEASSQKGHPICSTIVCSLEASDRSYPHSNHRGMNTRKGIIGPNLEAAHHRMGGTCWFCQYGLFLITFSKHLLLIYRKTIKFSYTHNVLT